MHGTPAIITYIKILSFYEVFPQSHFIEIIHFEFNFSRALIDGTWLAKCLCQNLDFQCQQ